MWQGFEGRQFPRIQTDCRIYITKDTHHQPITARTENIGAGGICVLLDEPLPKLSMVNVKLDIDDGGQPISCVAQVVWTVERKEFNAKKKLHDIGMSFIDLDDASKRRIEEIIKTTTN
ncbi:MAG: hypothetical protein COV74_05450 [Candidatus Omnitrophica bacterium CG11_big_fil_rev_8_21_14_0_20_45_26]|uniref:PilZ domain-containing protein n=1 Tax=Candidatus Abzuiibacterium crystallinum TaxID=1974748 RepID=A0A2H0LPN2_9BACT|nr:MAG: hypothetical protein COV74_05450 [Candidatus Omnitrophica bacterium CG11_big_fil_rev_8_21_14_0_20_45_26]PIW64336.1 MAG: hypothetical protein COW12_06770 [Candidatus Omnitrophica bacterium CG12_big_fil_rev_8_21_14_0_65_45_16]